MSEWIDIKDKSPLNWQEVIVYAPNGKDQKPEIICQATHANGRFSSGDYYTSYLSGVTHWMRMPQPPEIEV